jgi:hypothetical protein
MIAAHFGVACDWVKTIHAREIGFKRFSKRRLPSQRNHIQKKPEVEFSRDLLEILQAN